MSKKNFKKIFFGLILIVVAVFFVFEAFYYWKVKPQVDAQQQMAAKKSSAQNIKLDNVEKRVAELKKAQSSSPAKPAAVETKKAQLPAQPQTASPPPKKITLESLVQASQKVYGPDEAQKSEGSLWVDRGSSKYVVTLGALNGVLPGKTLSVYSDNQKIGQVVVDTAFDVISYVHPTEGSFSVSSGDYYRVVKE